MCQRMRLGKLMPWIAVVVLVLTCALPTMAQNSAPDAPQPQLPAAPQASQPTPQTQDPADSSQTPPLQSPPRSDTPAQTEPAKKLDPKDFPFPDSADSGAKQPAPDRSKPGQAKPDQAAPGKNDFPFPEEEEKTPAATAPPKDMPPPPPLEPGSSSSSSSSSSSLHDEGSTGTVGGVVDVKRAEQDKSIARFYWNRGNYEGSYLRFKDAVVYAPLNPDMWFGLAESERMVGKNVNARQHYKKYLELAPEGPKAKDSAKMLQTLPDKDKVQPAGPGPRVP